MISVLLLDDHPVVREGIRRVIDGTPGLRVSGEAGDAAQAMQWLQAGQADVVLLDLDLPGRSGLAVLRDIKRRHPDIAVLVFSFHDEAAFGVPALQAGADGYLMKDSGGAELVRALVKVGSGGKFVTASLAEQLARSVSADAERPRHAVLSPRELEVLRLIGQGVPVSLIAEGMALSVKTVSTYRRRVLDKMGLTSTAQLMHYAIQHHLVD